MMNELDKAAVAYEYSLRHNPYNIQVCCFSCFCADQSLTTNVFQTLTAIANIFRKRESWAKAAEYLQVYWEENHSSTAFLNIGTASSATPASYLCRRSRAPLVCNYFVSADEEGGCCAAGGEGGSEQRRDVGHPRLHLPPQVPRPLSLFRQVGRLPSCHASEPVLFLPHRVRARDRTRRSGHACAWRSAQKCAPGPCGHAVRQPRPTHHHT
jgi:hypothetical protein